MATMVSFLLLVVMMLCPLHGQQVSSASASASAWPVGSARQGAPRECRFERLETLEPRDKVQSEAGFVEYFGRSDGGDDSGEVQQSCAGVVPIRVVVNPRGLLLPRYTNTHALVYILQGRGVVGFAFPGCKVGDEDDEQQQRQRTYSFRQGDVVAMPAGVAHWFYNDGNTPVVAVYALDISNNINQLDPTVRKFLLAGRFREGQHHYGKNVLRGFTVDMLADTMGVTADVAKKLQNEDDHGRGEIVFVHNGAQLSQQQQQGTWNSSSSSSPSGLQQAESLCSMEFTMSIDPRAGRRITRLNSQNFPILDLIQISAARVDLHKNAALPPFWNINAHSMLYVIQGRARIQVVDDNGRSVFDGVLRRNQVLIIPQNFVAAIKAQIEGFRYISFELNPNSAVSNLAGKNSMLRALPVDVIATTYRLSREEAGGLKKNRDEPFLFPPKYLHSNHGGFVE